MLFAVHLWLWSTLHDKHGRSVLLGAWTASGARQCQKSDPICDDNLSDHLLTLLGNGSLFAGAGINVALFTNGWYFGIMQPRCSATLLSSYARGKAKPKADLSIPTPQQVKITWYIFMLGCSRIDILRFDRWPWIISEEQVPGLRTVTGGFRALGPQWSFYFSLSRAEPCARSSATRSTIAC